MWVNAQAERSPTSSPRAEDGEDGEEEAAAARPLAGVGGSALSSISAAASDSLAPAMVVTDQRALEESWKTFKVAVQGAEVQQLKIGSLLEEAKEQRKELGAQTKEFRAVPPAERGKAIGPLVCRRPPYTALHCLSVLSPEPTIPCR
jgi:hypothetical protein